MRVVRVLGSLDPAFGGPSVSALNSCIAVQRAGIQTIVAVPVNEAHSLQIRPILGRFHQEGIEIRTFPLVRVLCDKARRWAVSFDLARWLRSAVKDCDIIHCHSAWLFASIIAMRMANWNSKPVILSPHESLTKFDLKSVSSLSGLAKRALKLIYMRGLNGIIFSSPLELRDSLAGLDPNRCSFVYHAVYDERVEAQQPRDWSITNQKLKVGFLARLHPKKNLEILIRALSQLPEEVTLVVAGRGPESYEKDLYQLAERERATQRIHFVGFISEQQKPEFFRSIDVLAMPSAYECFGMSAAEAMLHGVPVIVSTETGVADVVKRYHCGIVAQVKTKAIAQAIISIWHTRRDLPEISVRAIQAVTREFSFATHGANLRRLYENILAGSGEAKFDKVGRGRFASFLK